jgi:hypothetical protein
MTNPDEYSEIFDKLKENEEVNIEINEQFASMTIDSTEVDDELSLLEQEIGKEKDDDEYMKNYGDLFPDKLPFKKVS